MIVKTAYLLYRRYANGVLRSLARVDKKDATNLFSYKILFFRNLDILRCENH